MKQMQKKNGIYHIKQNGERKGIRWTIIAMILDICGGIMFEQGYSFIDVIFKQNMY